MRIGIPSGIGDISWMISKLINAPEWGELEFEIADGWPYRAQDYMAMIGKPKSTYGEFNYEFIVAFEAVHPYKLWKEVASNSFGISYMQPNHHLERGKPLAEWLPDLSTSYHYPLNIPSIAGRPWNTLDDKKKYVGISAASYRGHKAWKTWPLEEWSALCKKLIIHGYDIVLMGGSWDDLTRALQFELPSNVCTNLVGMTSFPEACALHKKLNFYIGFSSGLGIIRTVMRLPTMMLWPSHQMALSSSWADPEDIISGMYIPSMYTEAKFIYNIFRVQEMRVKS